MEPGTVIAERYRLGARIGSGGTSVVWRAVDERLDREIAVKILRPEMEPDEQPVKRFEREAKTLAGLTGSGFVEVYDYGTEEHDGEQVWFIAMELVETGSLSALLDERGRLPADETMRLVAETAESLDKAHRRGVVHRDVKPGNLLIDEDGHVRIVDFGISLLTERTRLTRHSAVLGTPHYIAPEQFGKDELTGAADLYSLGVVAYECLGGAPPFTGERKETVIHGHLYDDPPPLPEEVPEAVSAIVMRCLRKDPADRWESGAELAAACTAAIEAVPQDTGTIALTKSPEPPAQDDRDPSSDATVPTRNPESPTQVDRRPERRKRLLALLIPLLLAALIGAAVLIPWENLPLAQGSTDEETTAAAAGTPTPSENPSGEQATPDEAPSTTAEPGETPSNPSPAATEDAGGNDGTSDGGGDDGGSSEGGSNEGGSGGGGSGGGNSDGDEPEPSQDDGGGGAELPDLYGVPVAEAQSRLHDLGFTDVVPQANSNNGGNYDLEFCQVIGQSPDAGARPDYGDTIVITYFAYASHLCW